MTKKELTKQQLRDRICDNCDHRTMSNKEILRYIAQWKEEPPFNWCRYRKNHPRENTCMHWTDDITEEIESEIGVEAFETSGSHPAIEEWLEWTKSGGF